MISPNPIGWPNPLRMPKVFAKGKILYVYWKSPEYLGGLNSSLINYEIYKKDYRGKTNLKKYNCSSVDNRCNKTISYRDLRIGGQESYYITLSIKRPANMMCLKYNMPYTVTSMKSSIVLSKIVGELCKSCAPNIALKYLATYISNVIIHT